MRSITREDDIAFPVVFSNTPTKHPEPIAKDLRRRIQASCCFERFQAKLLVLTFDRILIPVKVGDEYGVIVKVVCYNEA